MLLLVVWCLDLPISSPTPAVPHQQSLTSSPTSAVTEREQINLRVNLNVTFSRLVFGLAN